MNVILLSVVVVTAFALAGAAAWTWRALATVGDELHDFAGFDVVHADDVRDPRRP